MEKQIFKLDDKVFDIEHGWGIVKSTDYFTTYPIRVKYGDNYVIYTIDGKKNIQSIFPTLSFKEYSPDDRFTQERPVDYKSCIGSYGRFWDNEEKTFVIGELFDYLPHLIRAFEMKGKDSQIFCYENFKPLTEEQLKILGLKN